MNFDSEIAALGKRVDFSPLDGKSILITGGSGFVGSWLRMGLEAAYKQGVKYTACIHNCLSFGWWLLKTPEHFDYVIHAAPVFDRYVMHHIQDTHPQRVLYTSSGAVYARELNDYGRSKIDAENALLNSGMNVRIARLFTFCAPFMRMDSKAVVNFVRNALDGKPLVVSGDGSTVRTYMYGVDLSVWLWNILLYGEMGGIYDVGSEWTISILELAKLVKRLTGSASDIQVLNDGRYEYMPKYVPDTSRARHELAVKEQYLIEYQILKLADWMKEGE